MSRALQVIVREYILNVFAFLAAQEVFLDLSRILSISSPYSLFLFPDEQLPPPSGAGGLLPESGRRRSKRLRRVIKLVTSSSVRRGGLTDDDDDDDDNAAFTAPVGW